MTELTVTCVFVRGHVDFTPEYVIRLQSMAKRLLPPHRFVCLTDQPTALPEGVETIPARAPKGAFAWWAKVQLFNPALQLSGRCIYFDLDTLLVGRLDEVINFPAPFALVPDGAPNFVPRTLHLKVVKRFNSSVMVWDGGVHPEISTDWEFSVTQRLWGDQDWIGETCYNAATMPLEWFPRLSQCTDTGWPEEARVVLCKKPKNLAAAQKWPWFNEAWQ